MPATTTQGGRLRGNDQQTEHLSSYLSERFELLRARVGRPGVDADDPFSATR